MNIVLRKVFRSAVTLFSVITLSFVIIRLMPGGPVDALITRLVNQNYSASEINRLVEVYLSVNPQKPPLEAYVDYMLSILQGNFGRSIRYNRPVIEILAQGLPWTLFYASVSLFVSFATGVTAGAVMAYKERSTLDKTLSVSFIIIQSIPYYVLGIALLAVLAYHYGWFPTGGKMAEDTTVGPNLPFLLGIVHHATLPILSSIIIGLGGFAIGMRANSINVLGNEYIRVAEARGLSGFRIASRYVGRNAILPLYTRLLLSLGGLFGGSIVLEEIFRYTGVGYYMFKAVSTRDLPLMMGGFILISVAVITGVFVADLTYSLIDPRISSGNGSTVRPKRENSSLEALRRLVRSDSDRSFFERFDSSFGLTSIAGVAAVLASKTTDLGLGQVESTIAGGYRLAVNYVKVIGGVASTDWRAAVGLVIVAFYCLLGTVGVLLVDRTEIHDGPILAQPFTNMRYPLGTDALGQDLLALVVHSTPAMLKMLLAGAVFTTILATAIATFAGFRGGMVDAVLMTATDTALTLPGLPLIMVLSVVFTPENPYMVGVLLSITSWAGLARNLRSEVLSLREDAYVEAAEVIGDSRHTIIVQDIIPNLMPYILINFVGSGRRVIYSSVALYFLGILPFSNLNWGVMLNQAYEGGAMLAFETLYWLLIPMSVIIVLSLGLILTAQSLDRIFNPRIRAKYT
jgi:ABC-type dipeptide/oligopeptide/nickel transport system permease component